MSRVLHLLPVWFALFIITGLGGDRSGSKTPLNSRGFYSKLLLNKYLTKSVVRTTKILKGELITFYLHPFEKAIPDWVAFFSLSLLPSFLLLPFFFFLEGDKCSTLWAQHNRPGSAAEERGQMSSLKSFPSHLLRVIEQATLPPHPQGPPM